MKVEVVLKEGKLGQVWALLCHHHIFCATCKPQDMQSRSRPVGTVYKAMIVDFDVVRLNRALAGGSDLGITLRVAHSIGAEEHGIFIRCGNEVGDLLHGKGIANIKNPRARVKPGKDRQFPVVGGIKRLSYRMCSE